MHELGITRNVVAIAEEHAQGKKVKRILLEIGANSAIMPEAIRFCFDICNQNTLSAQAELEIIETKALAQCLSCQAEFELQLSDNQCDCGSQDFKRIAGEEMLVKEIELF